MQEVDAVPGLVGHDGDDWRTAQKMLLGRRVHLFDVPRWAIPPVPCRGVPLASSSFIDLTSAEAPTEQPATREPALSVS